jgi:hypothetical protein
MTNRASFAATLKWLGYTAPILLAAGCAGAYEPRADSAHAGVLAAECESAEPSTQDCSVSPPGDDPVVQPTACAVALEAASSEMSASFATSEAALEALLDADSDWLKGACRKLAKALLPCITVPLKLSELCDSLCAPLKRWPKVFDGCVSKCRKTGGEGVTDAVIDYFCRDMEIGVHICGAACKDPPTESDRRKCIDCCDQNFRDGPPGPESNSACRALCPTYKD